ncbi:hypothetical protein IBT47_10435 [Erwinia sp. S43]|uniref:hypothetical protein n=1 Tax=Erwinia sp. S43 TaxID=2769339 RepID=UPI00190A5441|nr:hypothetical protein [Erwinia sp. S43]MBK0032700.1 hypothetical protein [Erwinia sp. S43]
MKDYKESLLAGLQLAKQAEKNKLEISCTISAASDQISEITEKKAKLGIRNFYKDGMSGDIYGASLIKFNEILGKKDIREKYQALAILDSEDKNPIEVAEWSQSDNGYPCTISYNGQKLFCSTKEELENTLEGLLLEVKTGKAILSQINRFDKIAESKIAKAQTDNSPPVKDD